MNTKEELMKNVTCYLYENLRLRDDEKINPDLRRDYSQTEIEPYIYNIEKMAEYLKMKNKSIDMISLETCPNYSMKQLRFLSNGKFKEIKMEGSEGYYQSYLLREILKSLSLYNEKIGYNKLIYMSNFSKFYGNYLKQENINNYSTILNYLSEGIEKYVEFGMELLELLMPTNTYTVDIFKDKLGLINFDLYETHSNNESISNTLFTTLDIGDNGLNVLYDETFILKLRLIKSAELNEDIIRLYIERKDKQGILF